MQLAHEIPVAERVLDEAFTNILFRLATPRQPAAFLGSATVPGGNRQERRKRKKAERTARKRGR